MTTESAPKRSDVVSTETGCPQAPPAGRVKLMMVQLPVPRIPQSPVSHSSTAAPCEFIEKAGAPEVPGRTSSGVVHDPPAGRSAVQAPALVHQTAVAVPAAVSWTTGSGTMMSVEGETRSALFQA